MNVQETEKDWLAEHAKNLASASSGWATFQNRVHHWMLATFGIEVACDVRERCHHFLEEALELVQSLDCTASEAHQCVDHVFGRPAGQPPQEIGGTMVCLAALATAKGYIVEDSAEVELRRNWQNMRRIQAKWLAKPKHSLLSAQINTGHVSELTALQAENARLRVRVDELLRANNEFENRARVVTRELTLARPLIAVGDDLYASMVSMDDQTRFQQQAVDGYAEARKAYHEMYPGDADRLEALGEDPYTIHEIRPEADALTTQSGSLREGPV